jgi:phosphoenolpyruvate carboxykinase (GTP)
VLERVEGGGDYVDSPIGRVPTPTAIDTTGLDIDDTTMAKLVAVDPDGWRQEVPQIEEHYASLGERVPTELRDELKRLEKRLAGR